ncbi:hypothetical protein [Massilia cavernae]|uniref:hypothetical protein n=1 Tax=Massilia cavernae TaxID=2320864 RepID=UPI0016027A69|nr:hypothetical protein [Massilia cavernae]
MSIKKAINFLHPSSSRPDIADNGTAAAMGLAAASNSTGTNGRPGDWVLFNF